jgi:hypothetical protein
LILIDYSIPFQYHTDTDIVIINLTAVSLHPHDTGMGSPVLGDH